MKNRRYWVQTEDKLNFPNASICTFAYMKAPNEREAGEIDWLNYIWVSFAFMYTGVEYRAGGYLDPLSEEAVNHFKKDFPHHYCLILLVPNILA